MLLASIPDLLQRIAICLVVYEASWVVYCRFFHPLHSIPGPFLASVSRLWVVLNNVKGDMEYTQRALHKKYGHYFQTFSISLATVDVLSSD